MMTMMMMMMMVVVVVVYIDAVICCCSTLSGCMKYVRVAVCGFLVLFVHHSVDQTMAARQYSSCSY